MNEYELFTIIHTGNGFNIVLPKNEREGNTKYFEKDFDTIENLLNETIKKIEKI